MSEIQMLVDSLIRKRNDRIAKREMIETMPFGDVARGMQWLLPHLEEQISRLDKRITHLTRQKQ
jgi:hypothetical protein